mgnify:CR=1 FL=1|tara:strand:+ start:125 stop:328 length:204 start_codon:yes stop_codon:yes gene_type:complete
MKKETKQIKYLHESRLIKSDSLGLEHKDKVANYNRERKKQQDKHIQELKEKGLVTDNTWKLVTGFKY